MALFLGMGGESWGQISITTANTAVTQDFNTLVQTGNSSTLPTGWSFLESGSSADLTYSGSSGGSGTGDTYSFGVAGTNVVGDRTFGVLQSNNLSSILGFKFTNNTGSTVTSITVGYTGEEWRKASTADILAVSYQSGNIALGVTTGWTAVSGLTFTTPVVGTAAALDGNASANRTVISPIIITGLSITNGTTYTFRWVDATGSSSAGMGIDDFTITLNTGTTLTPPSISATTSPISVDNNFTVTYNTDNPFTTAIGTGNITISNGTTTNTLTAGTDYNLSGNNTITFTPSVSGSTLLHTPGTYTISVNATGYNATTVTQVLTVGAAAKLNVAIQPAAPTTNGAILGTQPLVTIQDKYGNATTSTASVTATATQATWTAGGTTTVTASSGTATFTNLTATSATAVTGATITFTAAGLTPATSGPFNIPAPIIDYLSLSTAGVATTENFNSMGTLSTATIPTGFKANIKTTSQGIPTWSETSYNKTNTTQSAGTTPGSTDVLTTSSTSGVYNLADGTTATSTDRALGFVTTSNYPTTTATNNTGLSVLTKSKNNTGSTLLRVVVSFDYELYRANANETAASFYYSLDGSTWISLSAGNQTFPSANAAVQNPPPTTSKTVAITGLNLAAGADIYFRWSYTATTGSNATIIGLDNVSVTGCSSLSTPSVSIAVTFGTNPTCTSTPVTFTATPTNGGSTPRYQWQKDGVNISGATSATYVDPGTTAGTISVVMTSSLVCVSSATANSNSISLTLSPATAITTQLDQNPQNVCQGTGTYTLSVAATGAGTLMYQWYKNANPNNTSGTPISEANSSSYLIDNTAAGNYYYYVIVTGTCGSVTSNISGFISVSSTSITQQPAISTTYCQNATATTLSITTAGNVSGLQWYSNNTNSNTGGTAILNATGFTYTPQTSIPGTTYYYVQVTGCGTASSNTAQVVVNSTPVATFASSTYSACEGTASPIIINGTTGATVTYTINGGTAQTITLTSANTTLNSQSSPANTYTYIITGISLNGCIGTSGSTTTVTINQLPTNSPISGPANVAIGNTISLSDATTGGVWSDNGTGAATLNSTTNNPTTITGNSVGTTIVSYTTKNNTTQCTNTASLSINVYNASVANYRTISDGNFTNAAIWEINTSGNNWEPAANAPSNDNNILIRNNVTLNTDYSGTSQTTFVINSGSLTITPNHYFKSTGGVNFNGNLVTVRSDASGTGAIGTITNGSAISGATNVTVERYIPKKRAWRLITSPVTSATINSAWQEGNLWDGTGTLPSTGHGTLITGYAQSTAANANNHGYDFWSSTANTTSSIRIYQPDATSGSWVSLPSIAGVKISDYAAFMLFVRGDRSVNLTTDTSATTLRANGTLNQADNISVTVDHTKAYTLIGNPYASPIDFEQMYNASANIAPQFLVWSSKTGTYGAYILVRRDAANTYSAVPSPFVDLGTTLASGQYIQSGEGFFVQPSNTTMNGTFRISEASKSPSQTTLPNPFKLSPGTERKLWVNLNLKNNDTSSTLADGVLMRYDATYDNGLNEDDAIKQANFNENLGVQSRNNSLLIMEARSDIQRADTLQLNLWNTTLRTYQLQIKGDNFASSMNLHAFLEDSYLQTKQEVSLSGSVTTVDFTVNGDTASYNHNRFRIVFQNDAVLPVTLTQVKAALSGNGVSVTWTVTNETGINAYTVERSTDGGRTYNTVATQAAKNGGAAITTYNSLDAQPQIGDNLYRIRSEAGNGQVIYSLVVKVTVTAGKAVQITFYPNPVRKDGLVNMQLAGLKQGSYLMSIYSHNGQVVYQRKITVSQDNATQTETLHLGASLVQGSYEVSLTDKAGMNVFKDQIVIGK